MQIDYNIIFQTLCIRILYFLRILKGFWKTLFKLFWWSFNFTAAQFLLNKREIQNRKLNGKPILVNCSNFNHFRTSKPSTGKPLLIPYLSFIQNFHDNLWIRKFRLISEFLNFLEFEIFYNHPNFGNLTNLWFWSHIS